MRGQHWAPRRSWANEPGRVRPRRHNGSHHHGEGHDHHRHFARPSGAGGGLDGPGGGGIRFAPGLLIVSHYLFLSTEWDVGLSWHVMVPPDDWAEIYLRPRDEMKPSSAFRLGSQDAALNQGVVQVAPPEEAVR